MAFETFKAQGKGLGLKSLKEFDVGCKVLEDTPAVCILCAKSRSLFCHYCFSSSDRLLRCSGCKFARYCGHQCQTKAWKMHKNECERLKSVAPQVPTDLVRLMYRVLLMKLSQTRMTWYHDMVSNMDLVTEKRKEEFVAILAVLGHFSGQEFMMRFTYSEILELFAKISCNSFSICDGEMQPIGVGLYPVASRLNHSCNPNCVTVFKGSQLVIRPVTKIRFGDELCISYTELLVSANVRQHELKHQYFFDCCCEKCVKEEDWLVNSYVCANDNCDSAVPETGDCIKCGTRRDVGEMFDICEKAQATLREVKGYSNDPIKKMELCDGAVKQQECILSPYHYLLVATLDQAFDACISASEWNKGLNYGLRTVEPYRHLYQPYHPNIGIQLFRIGKLQIFIEDIESGIQTLQKALLILQVTHGEDHLIVNQLKETIALTSQEYSQKLCL